MKKNCIKFLFTGIIIFHLTMTVLFLLPANPAKKYYLQWNQTYINSLFAQNWNLFSPDPIIYNLKMFYRCDGKNGSSTPWLDPIANLIKEHQENRFSFKGKLIYVYHGMYRNLLNKKNEINKKYNCKIEDSKCIQIIKSKLAKTVEFKKTKQFVETLCTRNGYLGEAPFKILKIYPKKFSERNNKNAKKTVLLQINSEDYNESIVSSFSKI